MIEAGFALITFPLRFEFFPDLPIQKQHVYLCSHSLRDAQDDHLQLPANISRRVYDTTSLSYRRGSNPAFPPTLVKRNRQRITVRALQPSEGTTILCVVESTTSGDKRVISGRPGGSVTIEFVSR